MFNSQLEKSKFTERRSLSPNNAELHAGRSPVQVPERRGAGTSSFRHRHRMASEVRQLVNAKQRYRPH